MKPPLRLWSSSQFSQDLGNHRQCIGVVAIRECALGLKNHTDVTIIAVLIEQYSAPITRAAVAVTVVGCIEQSRTVRHEPRTHRVIGE